MGNTYTQLLLHVVFATKERRPFLHAEVENRIHDYLGRIVRSEGGTPCRIGGMPDHVHLLIGWLADESVSNFLRNLKANSSKWIHQTFPNLGDFAWQEGYAAFSVSASQRAKVDAYIANQKEHHARRDFTSELKALLHHHGIEFDERYL